MGRWEVFGLDIYVGKGARQSTPTATSSGTCNATHNVDDVPHYARSLGVDIGRAV